MTLFYFFGHVQLLRMFYTYATLQPLHLPAP